MAIDASVLPQGRACDLRQDTCGDIEPVGSQACCLHSDPPMCMEFTPCQAWKAAKACDEQGKSYDVKTGLCFEPGQIGPNGPGPGNGKLAGFLEGEIWGLPKVAVYGTAAVLAIYLYRKQSQKSVRKRTRKTQKK